MTTARVATSSSLAAKFEAAELDWIIPRWSAPSHVKSFFTTRNAGRANAEALMPDADEATSANRADANDLRTPTFLRDANLRRARAFMPATPLWLDQVHGADVVDADTLTASTTLPPADASVTRATNVVLAVRVADCLPVLFSNRRGSTIAAAHAGWRGLAAGVLENTITAMRCDPREIVAWLGPAIGARAFEVGPEVREAFIAWDAADANAFVAGAGGKWHADLALIARQRLARAGVPDVTVDGRCTWTNHQFFSYRRDRGAGRMAAFIWRAET
jgi:YfiH family protein